jgi:DNA/RNA endonuclease G (NUC1)
MENLYYLPISYRFMNDSAVPIPTHYYTIVTKPRDTAESTYRKNDVMAFVLPHKNVPTTCQVSKSINRVRYSLVCHFLMLPNKNWAIGNFFQKSSSAQFREVVIIMRYK